MGNVRGKKPPFTGLESPAIARNGVVAIAEFRAFGLVDGIFEENRARSAEKLSFDQTKIVRLLLNASLPTKQPPPSSSPRTAPGLRHRAAVADRGRLRRRRRWRCTAVARHRLQARDALLHRRMGREQAGQAAGRERV